MPAVPRTQHRRYLLLELRVIPPHDIPTTASKTAAGPPMTNALFSALLITGTVTEIDDDDPEATRKYVYQRVGPGLGHRKLSKSRDLQRRRHVIPADNPTPYQLALRARFADAVAAWHSLTTEQKIIYHSRAEEHRWLPINQHMREYIRAHPLDPADYPDAPDLPNTMEPQQRLIHRPGALPGVARVTNPRAVEIIATHPNQPPGVKPPLHVAPGQLRK